MSETIQITEAGLKAAETTRQVAFATGRTFLEQAEDIVDVGMSHPGQQAMAEFILAFAKIVDKTDRRVPLDE